MINKATTILCSLLLMSSNLFAQEIEMADGLRSNGKIYVVVVVAAIVVSVILTYMISIDRKISRLEKKILDRNKK